MQGGTALEGVWWATASAVHPQYLQTDEKRLTMTETNVQRYRDAQSDMLLQHLVGEARFHVLDMHRITSLAPHSSTADGIHYTEAVYDAAANVLMNLVAAQPAQGTAKRACGNCDLTAFSVRPVPRLSLIHI